jgi:ribosomal protein S16
MVNGSSLRLCACLKCQAFYNVAGKWEEEKPREGRKIEIVGAYFPMYYYQWG